ncbi:uncharacterized protein [Typha angustifolia]|uniref:uncharacterized protein n=1 Tax=Typha angustifolia TaxID=59011 RepID=UPI003C302F0F
MEVGLIDGAMVSDFVFDSAAFDVAAGRVFSLMDCDGDGLLSRREVIEGLAAELFSGEYSAAEVKADGVFAAFDGHKGWVVGRMEFGWSLGELMLAMASEFAGTPIREGSLLAMVVEHHRLKKLSIPDVDLDGWDSF